MTLSQIKFGQPVGTKDATKYKVQSTNNVELWMKSFSDDADKKHGSVFVKVQSTNNKVQSTKYKVQIMLNFELWIGGFCFELCRFIKAE